MWYINYVMSLRKRIGIIILLTITILGVAAFAVLDRMSEVAFTENAYGRVVDGFYKEPKGSLDGVYIGSSAVYRYWNAPMAYEEYGIAVYSMSTGVQPITLAEYLLKEADRMQDNLQFALVELRNISKSANGYEDEYLKYVTDAMPYSVNRAKAIKAYMDFAESISADIDPNSLDYHLPMVRYKGRWIKNLASEEESRATKKEYHDFKGFLPASGARAVTCEDMGEQAMRKELPEGRKQLLDDLAETAKAMDFDVIFVQAPWYAKEEKMGLVNSACDYMRDKGFTVLNFNEEPLRSALAMDWSSEFYNERHVTIDGACRYTEFLSEYLKDKYNLTDHRGDPEYESWEEAVEALNKI